jgi:VanZ family protein
VTASARQPLRYFRFWLAMGWLLVILSVIVSLVPNLPTFTVPYSDKIFHAGTYFLLMTWFSGIFLPSRYWAIALSLVAMGLATEFLQTVFPYRFFDPWDLAANVAGVATAWLFALAGLNSWCRVVEYKIGR